MPLNRNQILDVSDIVIEKIFIPEWKNEEKGFDGEVFIRGMTGAERDLFESVVFNPDGNLDVINFRARLASMTVCDEKGERLFTEDDILALSKKSSSALQKIMRVAQRLSGLVPGDIKKLEKNSKSVQ